jgi:hypothetical protein
MHLIKVRVSPDRQVTEALELFLVVSSELVRVQTMRGDLQLDERLGELPTVRERDVGAANGPTVVLNEDVRQGCGAARGEDGRQQVFQQSTEAVMQRRLDSRSDAGSRGGAQILTNQPGVIDKRLLDRRSRHPLVSPSVALPLARPHFGNYP